MNEIIQGEKVEKDISNESSGISFLSANWIDHSCLSALLIQN